MKTCLQCQEGFEIPQDELDFLKKMDFVFGSTVISMPEPLLCPDCANQVRTSHRNERNLYQRKSDFSGKQMISLFAPVAPWGVDYKVYNGEEWNSDKWDPMDYGRDYDFDRPFFDQFRDLHKDVPQLGLMTVGNDNSPYTTGTAYCRNCHMINSSENCEDCYFGKLLQDCKNSVDCSYLYDSELCYQCFNCYKCYNCVELSYSQNCSDCWFSENLQGCKNCFLSSNLKNKEFYFMNQPLDKGEYMKRVDEFVGSYRNYIRAKELLDKLRLKRIHKYSNIIGSDNCTGDFITNSQNCNNCYDVNDSQDCRNLWLGVNVKDVYECSNMYLKQELQYQVLGTIETYHCAFTNYVFHSQDILYCDNIHNSSDLFACVGLKKKKYCILNKQYTQDEYNDLVPRIIEHMKITVEPSLLSVGKGQVSGGGWGHYFPPQYSPFAYNETLANEYYPLARSEVLSRGWNWHEDIEGASYQGAKVEIADHIDDVSDDIVGKILICQDTDKPYKIMKQEFEFYKKLRLPIPRVCDAKRYDDRMLLRNPRKLWNRKCDKCEKGIETTYAPDRSETVYCEECYLSTVY